MKQEFLSLVSGGRAALLALADVLRWRAPGRPSIAESVDASGASVAYAVRVTFHNPSSQTAIIDSAALMMGDEILFPLSTSADNQHDGWRLPLYLAAGSSEPFDFRPNQLANLVARHGGRSTVILHGVCQLLDGQHVKGRPTLFDIRSANSPPFKGSLTAQGLIAQVWAWLSDQYPRVQMLRRIGLADDVLYLTSQEMLAIRQKADTRDQPGSTYKGQSIVDFSMWKSGDKDRRGHWRAAMVLANKARIELVEDRS